MWGLEAQEERCEGSGEIAGTGSEDMARRERKRAPEVKSLLKCVGKIVNE